MTDAENAEGSIAMQHKKAYAAAEELRARGFVALFTGEPRDSVTRVSGRAGTTLSEPDRPPNDPGLYAGRVMRFLGAIERRDLLVEARTRISRTGSLTTYWTPQWVSALVAPLEAENPAVVRFLFEHLEHDVEKQKAIQASFALGGRRAVEDIVKQFVEDEMRKQLASKTLLGGYRP